jgi:hypothetical protein
LLKGNPIYEIARDNGLLVDGFERFIEQEEKPVKLIVPASTASLFQGL